MISLSIPDEFEWEGKGLEPAWFQDWARKKAEYIKKIAEQYEYLPNTIWYWKMDKIKEAFPLKEAAKVE